MLQNRHSQVPLGSTGIMETITYLPWLTIHWEGPIQTHLLPAIVAQEVLRVRDEGVLCF